MLLRVFPVAPIMELGSKKWKLIDHIMHSFRIHVFGTRNTVLPVLQSAKSV